MAQLTGRLERRLGRDVQIVRLADAERTPSLLADALDKGRVLVDRDRCWAELQSHRAMWRRRAAASDALSLDRAVPGLDLS